MSSFIEFFNRRKRQIDELVDRTFFRLLENTSAVDALFPARNYADSSILIAEVESYRPTLANIVAADQEVPTTRQILTINDRELKPYYGGKKVLWTSRDYELLDKLNLALAAGGGANKQLADAIEQSFFKRMVDLVPSVYERSLQFALLIATGQAIDYTDPITKARLQLAYSGTIPAHLPAPLTGNARWSQPATCQPLTNLQTHAEAIYGTGSNTGLGVWFDTLLMHWRNLRQVADSNEAKVAMMRRMGADTATPATDGIYLSDQQAIDLIKERTRATNVVLFDAQFSEENEDGSISNGEFLPSDYYVFMPAGRQNIKRAFVPVLGADGRKTAGVARVTKNNGDIPYREWTTVLGASIPAVSDPRYLAARRVA
jgi:hypothetical protein